ncbi:unnamed protein product [Vitrella brassicaformis CCMP3155]|uniref:Uncharacterized protein n=4 Tax=Vitrella brassicaformis TaxID=1169539 RepID=A0A0G4FGR6_VITBC|nr:unnamed protein product [Vitrella brassicaformis CCMP3155]|eukprot:CEM12690.1 unnamed protein product [Vitrella brassicaformis CCMP3155]
MADASLNLFESLTQSLEALYTSLVEQGASAAGVEVRLGSVLATVQRAFASITPAPATTRRPPAPSASSRPSQSQSQSHYPDNPLSPAAAPSAAPQSSVHSHVRRKGERGARLSGRAHQGQAGRDLRGGARRATGRGDGDGDLTPPASLQGEDAAFAAILAKAKKAVGLSDFPTAPQPSGSSSAAGAAAADEAKRKPTSPAAPPHTNDHVDGPADGAGGEDGCVGATLPFDVGDWQRLEYLRHRLNSTLAECERDPAMGPQQHREEFLSRLSARPPSPTPSLFGSPEPSPPPLAPRPLAAGEEALVKGVMFTCLASYAKEVIMSLPHFIDACHGQAWSRVIAEQPHEGWAGSEPWMRGFGNSLSLFAVCRWLEQVRQHFVNTAGTVGAERERQPDRRGPMALAMVRASDGAPHLQCATQLLQRVEPCTNSTSTSSSRRRGRREGGRRERERGSGDVGGDGEGLPMPCDAAFYRAADDLKRMNIPLKSIVDEYYDVVSAQQANRTLEQLIQLLDIFEAALDAIPPPQRPPREREGEHEHDSEMRTAYMHIYRAVSFLAQQCIQHQEDTQA